MQQTLILLKPDAVQRRLVGKITGRFERKGLRLASLKLLVASRELAEKHYAVHKGKPFYESLLQFLTSGPTVAMVWEGREAVAVGRNLMGLTDGAKAPPGTIRGDFASERAEQPGPRQRQRRERRRRDCALVQAGGVDEIRDRGREVGGIRKDSGKWGVAWDTILP